MRDRPTTAGSACRHWPAYRRLARVEHSHQTRQGFFSAFTAPKKHLVARCSSGIRCWGQVSDFCSVVTLMAAHVDLTYTSRKMALRTCPRPTNRHPCTLRITEFTLDRYRIARSLQSRTVNTPTTFLHHRSDLTSRNLSSALDNPLKPTQDQLLFRRIFIALTFVIPHPSPSSLPYIPI